MLFLSTFILINNGCSSIQPSSRHVNVTVCLLSNASDGLVCNDKDGKETFIKFPDAENFMCLSPSDAEQLF